MKIKVTKELPENSTIISAGALIVNREGFYIFEKRTKDCPYFPNGIEVFGGILEGDESPLECLRRELIEEMNFDFKKQGLVPELIGFQESLADDKKFNARYIIKNADFSDFKISKESAGKVLFSSFKDAINQEKYPVGFSVQGYKKLLENFNKK